MTISICVNSKLLGMMSSTKQENNRNFCGYFQFLCNLSTLGVGHTPV